MNRPGVTGARALGGAFALVVALALPGSVLACSCLVIPFEDEYANTSHVFTARALGSRTAAPEYPDHHYELLQVHAIWKGAVGPTVEVLIADNEASCGRYFTPDLDYLVFAQGTPGDPLFTHTCSRTWSYGPESPIWQQLGPPISLPVAAKTWGSVKAAYHR
jgi:hypothetical protein